MPDSPAVPSKPKRHSYVHCVECGVLVRLVQIDSPKEAPHAVCFGGGCPNCKSSAAVTFLPPNAPLVVVPSIVVPS